MVCSVALLWHRCTRWGSCGASALLTSATASTKTCTSQPPASPWWHLGNTRLYRARVNTSITPPRGTQCADTCGVSTCPFHQPFHQPCSPSCSKHPAPPVIHHPNLTRTCARGMTPSIASSRVFYMMISACRVNRTLVGAEPETASEPAGFWRAPGPATRAFKPGALSTGRAHCSSTSSPGRAPTFTACITSFPRVISGVRVLD